LWRLLNLQFFSGWQNHHNTFYANKILLNNIYIFLIIVMDSISPTLIFNEAETGLNERYSSNKIFTQEIAELVETYFRNGETSRYMAIKLLGETYENNYIGFIR
jgi:hypothetical protein